MPDWFGYLASLQGEVARTLATELRTGGLGTVAVAFALGVFGTGTGWPDLIVAAIMPALAVQGAGIVFPARFGRVASIRVADLGGGRVGPASEGPIHAAHSSKKSSCGADQEKEIAA
jgi:hypothetical protein